MASTRKQRKHQKMAAAHHDSTVSTASVASTTPAAPASPPSDSEPQSHPESISLPAAETGEQEIVKPAEPAADIALDAWQLCGDAVTGLAHRRLGLPCQDAVHLSASPRPIALLSDGAGSAAISERGAQTLVIGIARLLRTLEEELAEWLDTQRDNETDMIQSAKWANRLRQHAIGLLEDLARQERRPVRDVRATLQLVILGKQQIYWWKVGDGAIVARSADAMQVLGHHPDTKGEFANQTCFIDMARVEDIHYGLLPAHTIQGMALMSDGGAEKLVAHDGSKVAGRLANWLDELANQSFSIERIALAYHEPALWERTTLDDRALIMLARANE